MRETLQDQEDGASSQQQRHHVEIYSSLDIFRKHSRGLVDQDNGLIQGYGKRN